MVRSAACATRTGSRSSKGRKDAFHCPSRPDYTSPLLPTDFRKLEPGEAFDPTVGTDDGAAYFPLSLFGRICEATGRYSVSLTLNTDAPREECWLGTLPDRRPDAAEDRAAAQRLLRQVPRLQIRSNTLVITVIAD